MLKILQVKTLPQAPRKTSLKELLAPMLEDDRSIDDISFDIGDEVLIAGLQTFDPELYEKHPSNGPYIVDDIIENRYVHLEGWAKEDVVPFLIVRKKVTININLII